MFGRKIRKTKVGRLDFAICRVAAAVEEGLSSREGWQTLANGLTTHARQVGGMFLVSVFPAGWSRDSYISFYMNEEGDPLSAPMIKVPRLNLDTTFALSTVNGIFVLGREIVGMES
jgi:hypothetical protein